MFISFFKYHRADEEVVDPKKYLEESCKPKCVKPLLEYQVNWWWHCSFEQYTNHDCVCVCVCVCEDHCWLIQFFFCGSQACVKRIQGDESGHKHCTGQYFDYWHCIDKCVSSSSSGFPFDVHIISFFLRYNTEIKLEFGSQVAPKLFAKLKWKQRDSGHSIFLSLLHVIFKRMYKTQWMLNNCKPEYAKWLLFLSPSAVITFFLLQIF